MTSSPRPGGAGPDSTPAIVAGIGLNGLGVVRSLARENIPVVIIDADLNKPTAATRFGRKIKVATLSGPAFIDALLALRPLFPERPVLILTEEASVAAVAKSLESVRTAFRIALPDKNTIECLMDKAQFQAAAQKLGFRVPRAVVLTDRFEPRDNETFRFPAVLKPTTKDPAYATRFAKAYRVGDWDEVTRLWTDMRSTIATAILQEWIVGEDSDVYFCLQYRDQPDSSLASFVGRKILQWPPLVGGTASCVPAPEFADTLSVQTDRFFAAMGFRGFCSMEYKRDRRDGEFYMVEPTVGRTDYQEEIATLNGVNIPAAAYWAELGIPGKSTFDARSQKGWCDPVAQANAISASAGNRDRESLSAAPYVNGFFRANDPGPFIQLQLERFKRRAIRALEPQKS